MTGFPGTCRLLVRSFLILLITNSAACVSIEGNRVGKGISEPQLGLEKGFSVRAAPALWHLDDSDATLHAMAGVGRFTTEEFDYIRWEAGGQLRKPVFTFVQQRRQFWLGGEAAAAVRRDTSEKDCSVCTGYPGASGLSLSGLAGVSQLPETGLRLGLFAAFGVAFYPSELAGCRRCRREWIFRLGMDVQPWFLHPGQ